jgi:GNAT superfamily N-acetyltransferase
MAIRIESIPARALLDFAQRHAAAFPRQKIAAITRHRALAHSLNPHAQPGDIGLLVAYAESICIGYLGLLPAYVTDGRDRQALSFMTTFYVLPEYRRHRAAFALLNESLLLERDLVVTDYTPEAGHLYKALGFADLGHVDYFVLGASSSEHKRDCWLAYRAMVAGARPAMVSRIDRVPERVVHRGRATVDCGVRGKARFCRDGDVINWMLRYPWVREDTAASNPPYHFSDARPTFKHLAMRIEDREGAAGLLVLSLSERPKHRVIKMLDCQAPLDSMYPSFFHLVCTCAADFLADEVTLPNEMHTHLTRVGFPGDAGRWMRREYLHHAPSCGPSSMLSDPTGLHLSFCDGDTAFT